VTTNARVGQPARAFRYFNQLFESVANKEPQAQILMALGYLEDLLDEHPELLAVTDPDVLWPPNHKMAAVRVTLAAIDDASSLEDLFGTLRVTISSNEPESRGSGDLVGDVNGFGGFTAQVDVTGAFALNAGTGRIEGTVYLRAERFGQRAGRTYTLEAEVTDDEGNKGTAVLEIKVPHDLR
jgi:hypothetical protein